MKSERVTSLKNIKAIVSILFSVSIVIPVLGCAAQNNSTDTLLETAMPISSESASQTSGTVTQENTESYDTYVILSDTNTTIDGEGVTFKNNVLTVTQPGSYCIKGTLSDGHITVNSPDTSKKVKLYLNSVSIYSSDTAPIYIEESGKETEIILADGSVNTLSDNADRKVPEDENTEYATAVIYSKDDLQLEGNGTLNIEANFNKGIFTKDDLQIKGGTYNITSADDAVRGKDSVEISAGTFHLTSGGDGIRTSNETDEDKGEMLISGGEFNITSELDGIQSVSALTVSGGVFNIRSGGASSEITAQRENMFGSFPGARPSDSSADEAQGETEVSCKGVKGKSISITGGTFTVDSYDDAFHSDSTLNIPSGVFSVKTNDDAFHAETTLAISGASISILQSYEGLEGETVKITDGTIHIVSADDGINVASSAEQEENPNTPRGQTPPASPDTQGSQTPPSEKTGFVSGGQRPGNKGGMGGKGGMGSYNSANVIEISGGKIFVNADGDGHDSNGDIKISGGEVYVFGPESDGNGALDYSGSCVVTGGTLLAAGSSGMSQGVSEGSVASVNISCSVSGNTVFAVLDEDENEIVCFVSPKKFSNVVFASDSLDKNEEVSVYTDGTHSGTASDGIYEDGVYTKGTLLGQYTAG